MSDLKKSRISLLLGSGMSLKAGLPSTREITDEIMNHHKKWYQDGMRYSLKSPHQSGNYYDNRPSAHYPRKIAKFLKIIESEISNYYETKTNRTNQQINYEEIYDVVNQIEQSLFRTIDNPLTNLLINKLLTLIEPLTKSDDNLEGLKLLCSESKSYVKSILEIQLHNSGCSDYLNIIEEIRELERNRVFNIFTLNHDFLLENYFGKNCIGFCDGFSIDVEKGVRLWEPSLYENKNDINLLKLHGSINWRYVRAPEGIANISGYCMVTDWNQDYIIELNNKDSVFTFNPSLFLTGTNGKLSDYNFGIYLDLFYHFYRLLNQTDWLIVIGYSFGDPGVNLRLINWIVSDKNRRIIIIDPYVDQVIENSRGPIINVISGFHGYTGRIYKMNKKIENVKIVDIKSIIESQ